MSSKYRHHIVGERVFLREITFSDVGEEYCKWMNDKKVVQYTESRFVKHTIQSIQNYVESHRNDENSILLAIVKKDGNKHIGNIKIHINRQHLFADIGILIGDKNSWGMGYATEAITLVVKYAKESLGLHKLIAGSYVTNPGSIKAFKNAGFVEEGLFKKHYFCDGEYVDSVMLGLLME